MELKVFDIQEYEDFFNKKPKFIWSSVDIYDKPSKTLRKKLKNHLNVSELPEKLNELYDIIQEISIEYAYICSNGVINSGFCLIAGIENMIMGNPFVESVKKEDYLKEILWDENDNPDYINETKKYVIFDYISIVANSYVIAKLSEDKTLFELYLFIYPGYIFPLDVDVIQYVIISDQYRGMTGWQIYFINETKITAEEKDLLNNCWKSNVYENIKEIFPDADLGLLPEKSFLRKGPFIEDTAIINNHKRITDGFQNLKESIGNNGYFKLETEFKHRPREIDVYTINKAQYVIQQQLPEEFICFYIQYNGFHLDWANTLCIDENGYKAEAIFEIVPFHQIFGGREPFKNRRWGPGNYHGNVIMEDIMDDETLTIAMECYPILFSEQIDIVIRFIGGKRYELYGIIEGNYKKLSLSFAKLFEIIIGVMGINYWYLLLPEYKDVDKGSIYPDIKLFIKKLFPEFNALDI